jgi:Icc protein
MAAATSKKNAERNPIRLVQVTDTHLYANTSNVLVGMNCEQGLLDVIDLIQQKEKQVDAVLVTGDVSQDNSSASYQRLYDNLARLGAEQYWIPGNHDEIKAMQKALGGHPHSFQRCIDLGAWSVVMLCSNVVGAVHGLLQKVELELLESCLQQSGDRSVLVCLHHNPVPVKAAWLQQHALQNPEELFAVLDRYPQVKAVLFGHIHHELKKKRKGVAYLGSPSTSIQFHPSSTEFALDHRKPGYRWLELLPSGELRTGVNRVRNKRYAVDFSGVGY